MMKPQYRAYETGIEISIPANGDKDRWYVNRNGARGAVITEWADGFTVDGEVTAEVRSFIGELQACNRAAEVWADPVATATLYPHVGASPEAIRDGSPGNTFAQSAVRCSWDKTRYKLIPFS